VVGGHQNDDNFYSLLEPNSDDIYNQYRVAYSELLYRWGLLDKRAEILKFVHIPTPLHKGIVFGVVCDRCGRQLQDYFCKFCRIYAFKCAICHISVKGLSNFCMICSHGGHTQHIYEWFKVEQGCPTGCGCRCVLATNFNSSDSPISLPSNNTSLYSSSTISETSIYNHNASSSIGVNNSSNNISPLSNSSGGGSGGHASRASLLMTDETSRLLLFTQ